MGEYERLITEATRRERKAGLKKTPDPNIAIAQEAETQTSMAAFGSPTPPGNRIAKLEGLVRTTLYKPANELVGWFIQQAAVADIGMPSEFGFTFSPPSTESWPAGSLMGGFVTVEAQDVLNSMDGTASVLSVAPESAYVARINGIVQKQLWMDPFNLTVSAPGGSETFTAGFSGVTNTALAPGDNATIDLRLTTLGGGDIELRSPLRRGIPEPSGLFVERNRVFSRAREASQAPVVVTKEAILDALTRLVSPSACILENCCPEVDVGPPVRATARPSRQRLISTASKS